MKYSLPLILAVSIAHSQAEPLTQSNVVALVLRNNLGLQIEQIEPEIEDANLRAAWGEYEPTFNIRGVYESIENPQNTREFLATQNRFRDTETTDRLFSEENILFESSIEGLLPTGATWSLSTEINRLRNDVNVDPRSSQFFPEYDSFAGLRFTQPLLKDGVFRGKPPQIRVGQKNRELADLAFQTTLRTTVAETVKTFYDLVFARDDIAVKADAILLAQDLESANTRRVEEGVGSEIAVRQARVAKSTREEDLIASRNFFRERQNLLKRSLYQEYQSGELSPSHTLSPSVSGGSVTTLMSAALQTRPEYAQARTQIERQNIRLAYAKNQLYPRLDLVGTFGANGLSGSYTDAASDLTTGDGLQWSIGLVVSIPLGNRKAKAQRDTVRLELRQLVLNLKRLETDIALQIDTALSRITTARQRLTTARQSLGLARATLEEENRRLTEGLGDTFLILEAQGNLAAGRSRELAALADLNKAAIDLWLADGSLLDRLGVNLPTTAE